MTTQRKTTRNHRTGFTIIELLVVIAIIAALVALLVPAIMGGVRNARIAETRIDITALETGLSDFQNTYKVTSSPPSYIELYEQGGAAWTPSSKAAIKRYWPQFDFSKPRDINQDGSHTKLTLTGAECLLFFLAGVKDSSGVYNGFSKNPADPFSATGNNRYGPFYVDFENDRVVDKDGDGMGELVDKYSGQTMPYVYISSNGGSGYRGVDLMVTTTGGNDATGEGDLTRVYQQNSDTGPPFKPKGFQIISPGADGQYGRGGGFNPDTSESDLVGPRLQERDNITNFHNTVLAP